LRGDGYNKGHIEAQATRLTSESTMLFPRYKKPDESNHSPRIACYWRTIPKLYYKIVISD
jgi:hypothetical protein